MREAQSRPVNEVRSLYESLVAIFPTTARYWKIYIEQEVNIIKLKIPTQIRYIFNF